MNNFKEYFLNEAIECIVSWEDEFEGTPYAVIGRKGNNFICKPLSYIRGDWVKNDANTETVVFTKVGLYIKDPNFPKNKVELTNLNAVNAYVPPPRN